MTSQLGNPRHPTPYDELNGVLDELVHRAGEILGDNLVGAYLQGSFAVGDPDLHSDCDFLIPVHAQVTDTQEAGLRALHDELPTRPEHWAQHLEGSYPLLADLRNLDGLGREWLYVDHGWREMQWSTHCNSHVARWSLRERGVVLTGPSPTSFMDPLDPDGIRRQMRIEIPHELDQLRSWITLDIAWAQRYLVTTLCRMLYTLDTAEVTSKVRALTWAHDRLDPRWHALLDQVRADRDLGWDLQARPRPGSIQAAVAFAEEATRLSRDW